MREKSLTAEQARNKAPRKIIPDEDTGDTRSWRHVWDRPYEERHVPWGTPSRKRQKKFIISKYLQLFFIRWKSVSLFME